MVVAVVEMVLFPLLPSTTMTQYHWQQWHL